MRFILQCTLFIPLFVGGMLFGQRLSIVINPIVEVPVGGVFTVAGTITHDPNSTAIPAGTPLNIAIEVLDPSSNRILVTPVIQDFTGVDSGRVIPFSQTYTMPWSEDDKWTPAARWNASVSVSSPVLQLINVTQAFPLLIADLTLEVNSPTEARPGDFINLTGVVRNLQGVQTEPGVFFKVEAYIPDTPFNHSVVFPPEGSWSPGDPWPIAANSENNFTIPGVYIPPDTPDDEPLVIRVVVDDADPDLGTVPATEVIHEQEDLANNSVDHTITIDSGNADLQPSTDFLINGGLEGAFQGLDAIRCTVSIRNIGTGPIVDGDAFDYRVLLSNDATPSNDDFLLRQVDLGFTGLGNGLLPNETITLDWVQMLPDNFEGDYYVVTDLNGVLLNTRSTPSLSLRSENSINIEQENTDDTNGRTGRPSSNQNGLFIAYEAFDGNVTRIILKNIATTRTWDLTLGPDGASPNGSSYAPQVSADGRFVVFHSMARNLSPADRNNHADVFRYDVHQRRRVMISQAVSGKSTDGYSFYPTINDDGTKIAFETYASNLDTNATKSGKQIMLWTEDPELPGSGTGTFRAITQGNAASFDASISGDGSRIVFTTYATDLVAGETDDNGNPDVVLWENGNFHYAGRAEDGSLPLNGETKQPVISWDGKVVSFVSSARNMVSGKGIAHIQIEDAGVGYPAGSTVLINDINGSGASVRVSRLNPYGEIMAFSIDNPGRNYVNPSLTVATPGSAPLPDRNVSAIPLLVNPQGDVFRISVDAVKSGGGSERISESRPLDGDAGSETGGNLGSREPTISGDGTLIAYSTRSSNLQDLNVTSTNLKAYANHRFRPATAQAVLHWGIGAVIITNPGTGYLGTGTVEIEDLSGSGSGAVATYSVLQNGQVGSVTIVNPGSGYDLSQTLVSIQNDPTGTAFNYQILETDGTGLGANRTGGASIQRIEIIDAGIGYPSKLNPFLEKTDILIDGDGADLDQNGKPDARLNPDRLFIGTDGQVFIEQQIDVTIKSRLSLIGTTLSISDVNQTLVIEFATAPFSTIGRTVLGVDTNASGQPQDDTGLRNDLVRAITQFWGSPTNLSEGVMIENNASGGVSFTLRALNGSSESSNPSSLQVAYRSNMLIGGNGYTRATPFITPSPSVIGFSEVQTGTSTLVAPNGRPIFDAQEDLLTDDIYFYDHNFSQNRRISVSKFGFPTNYLAQTTLPSHRYPALSGNGRYVFFSSDASGLGGLLMGSSNQMPIGVNAMRDIYKVDTKSQVINHLSAVVDINLDLFEKTNYLLTHDQMMPVIADVTIPQGYLSQGHMYVNGDLALTISPVGIVRNAARFIFPFTPSREGYSSIHVVVEDSFGNTYRADAKIDVNVLPPEPEVMTGQMLVNPTTLGRDEIFIIHRNSRQIVDLGTGNSLGPGQTTSTMNIVTGPWSEDDIDSMIAFNDARISPFNDAYFASDAPLNFRPFFDLYPQRLRVTRASSVNVSANFINGYGKRSKLEKVVFYLNGKLLLEDVTAPYGVTFSPPLLNDDNKTIANNWVVTAQAVPLDGSRSFMLHRLGESGREIIMPSAVLSFTDEEVAQTSEVLDGDRVGVKLTLRGESNVLAGLFNTNEDPFSDEANASYDKKAHFIVNGIPLSSSVGVPVIDPSGEYTQVDYYAILNADFTQFSEPDGTLRIQALGEMSVFESFTPVYASNVLTLRIKEPMPWIDPLSAAVSVFNDISDDNLTKEQHARMDYLMQSGEDGLAKWVEELTNRASFQERVSVLASYHIVTGEWFESYFDLEDAINSVDLNASNTPSITRLKRYIDQTLGSARYEGKFASVPYLVGSFQMSNTFDFDANRRSFVEQCLTNKYSYLENDYNPAFQQLFQGSQRMLTRWAAFEPDYWELPSFTGTPPLTGFDSPPRRDSLTQNEFAAGECAVDLVYNLANETPMQGGAGDTSSYIIYSERIRDSIYQKATLMSLLWRANAFPLDNKFLRELSSISFDQAIKLLLADNRYTSRYNLIWRDSNPIGNIPDWKNESWFGNFYDKHFPWVYHERLGWLYMGGVTPVQFWFHHQTLGWLWTGRKYYPQVYSNNEQNWIYLYPESKAYYSHGSQALKSF